MEGGSVWAKFGNEPVTSHYRPNHRLITWELVPQDRNRKLPEEGKHWLFMQFLQPKVNICDDCTKCFLFCFYAA